MPSTYSTNLRLELIATGEQSGTWGNTTNTNLGTLIEQAISGVQSVAMSDANYTLTALNAATDESRNAVVVMTGTLSATRNVICPSVDKVYIVRNATTGGQSIVFKTSAGTGVTIANGTTQVVYCDATNVVAATPGFDPATSTLTATINGTATNVTGTVAVANGGTGATDAGTARTNLGLGTMATQAASSVSITGGSISGITDLAVADGGTGASSAPAARSNLGLGTISTQDAINVSITGGSITGITDLAVADGGTGASTAAGARQNILPSYTGNANRVLAVNGTATDVAWVAPGSSGTVTSVDVSGGTTGLTSSGGPVTTSGTITLAGTLSAANGGTGQTTYSSGQLLIGNASGGLTKATLTAGSNVTITNGDGAITIAASAGSSLSGVTDSATPFETALGYQAGNVSTGVNNTFIGYQSGLSNTTGTNNSAFGAAALYSNVTGNYNVAVGYSALTNNTASSNTAVGYRSLDANTTGNEIVAIGKDALGANTTGYRHVAIGTYALLSNTTGNENIGIGWYALQYCTTGFNNVAVGKEAGQSITTGNVNTIIGSDAGKNITTGANNTVIGNDAAASSATVSNEITLGNSSIATLRIPGLSVSWTSSTVPNVSTTATQTLSSKTIEAGTFTNGYTEEVGTANTGTAYTIDLANGSVQNLTLTGNCTFTFPTATAGRSFLLVLRQDATGSRTATWPTVTNPVRWPGGTAPTLTSTASRVDLFAFTADGSVWFGRTISQNHTA